MWSASLNVYFNNFDQKIILFENMKLYNTDKCKSYGCLNKIKMYVKEMKLQWIYYFNIFNKIIAKSCEKVFSGNNMELDENWGVCVFMGVKVWNKN